MYISNKYPLYKWMKSIGFEGHRLIWWRRDGTARRHSAGRHRGSPRSSGESRGGLWGPRVVSNGEGWSMVVWCRDSRRNTFDKKNHETLSLHHVYKRENVVRKFTSKKIHVLIDIYIMFTTCYITGSNVENISCSPCQALAGWLIHPWWNREKIHHASCRNHCHGAKSL